MNESSIVHAGYGVSDGEIRSDIEGFTNTLNDNLFAVILVNTSFKYIPYYFMAMSLHKSFILLFSCTRYHVRDTYFVHGIPIPGNIYYRSMVLNLVSI